MPPSLTQEPRVTSGWSTAAIAVSRPSTCTSDVRPDASNFPARRGYGPLCPVTPAAVASLSRSARSTNSPLLATTSGPRVAARVLSYGSSAASRTTSPSVSCSKSRSTSRVAALSRLPVSSSASTTVGSLLSARATATRCRWPPESAAGRNRDRPASPS